MNINTTPSNNVALNDVEFKVKAKRRAYSIQFKFQMIEEYKKSRNYYELSKTFKIAVSSLI
jgi:hypothetical protein